MLLIFWVVLILLGILSVIFSKRLAGPPFMELEEPDLFKRERRKYILVGAAMVAIPVVYAILFTGKICDWP